MTTQHPDATEIPLGENAHPSEDLMDQVEAAQKALAAAKRRRRQINTAYRDAFTGPGGKAALNDMMAAFGDRQSPELREKIDLIPHPYRAYVWEGLRFAIEHVLERYDAAEEPP